MEVSSLTSHLSQGSSLVIQNETLDFEITLQNPYVFDLELQSLSLRYANLTFCNAIPLIISSTSGVKFESQPARVIIPGNSYHHVILSGSPVETGILIVRGCTAQTPGGEPREFVLPMASDSEEEKLARKRGAAACEIGRFKYPGLSGFPWNREQGKRGSIPPISTTSKLQWLQCTVIHEQPLVRIRRTSLTHGAVMLYDGEV